MSLAPPVSASSEPRISVFKSANSRQDREHDTAHFVWLSSAIRFALIPVCTPLYLQNQDAIDLEYCIPLGT